MKLPVRWVIAAALVVVGAAAFCGSAGAAGPPPSAPVPAEPAPWKEGLAQAGASPAEIGQFEELLHLQSPAGLDALTERMRLPQFFTKYLRAVRQQEGRQETPKRLFQDGVSVRSCDSLLTVSIPNTRIESTRIDALDGSCRVTASV